MDGSKEKVWFIAAGSECFETGSPVPRKDKTGGLLLMRFLLGFALGSGLTGYYMWTKQQELKEAAARIQAAYEAAQRLAR